MMKDGRADVARVCIECVDVAYDDAFDTQVFSISMATLTFL